jgi:hypothetical protein
MTLTKYLAALALAAPLAMGTAQAAPTTLTLQSPGSQTFQQAFDKPCVIGDPSCQNPGGFGHTLIGSNNPAYTLTSPTYTVAQIETAIGGTSFFLGIDVNSTTHPLATEVLQSFSMAVNGTTVALFTGPTQLSDVNNGNGKSDDLITGFPDLSTLASTDAVTFTASLSNATDGEEEYFLVRTGATPAPEPFSLGVLSVGLLGLGLFARRGRN